MIQTDENMDGNDAQTINETCEGAELKSGMAGSLQNSVATLEKEAESIVAEINERRKEDAIILEELRNALQEQTELIMKRVEQELYKNYERSNDVIQSKLLELSDTLNNIEEHQSDIAAFKSKLVSFYKDIVSTEANSDF